MQDELAALMAEGDEILVGDGAGVERAVRRYPAEARYRHVTVFTCRQSARANEGSWDVLSFCDEAYSRSTRLGGYRFEAVKSEAMAVGADRGLMAWDGRSCGTFLAILMLVSLGKPVRVVRREGTTDVGCLEDAYKIIPAKGPLHHADVAGLPPEEQERIVDAFVPSRSMASFLAGEPLSKETIVEIVLGSPAPLVEKYEACMNCARYDDIYRETVDLVGATLGRMHVSEPRERVAMVRRCWNHVISSSFTTHRDAIGKALQALRVRPGELLYRKSVWDEQPELYEWHEQGIAPFDSLEAALEDLRYEMDDEGWDADAPCWSKLEKWRYSDARRMWYNTYTYYLIRDEVVFFEKNYWDGEERRWRPLWHFELDQRACAGMVGLSLPTPFEAGDIITLDCRPFAPLAHGLVLLPHDGKDGCKPYLLVRSHGEKSSAGEDPWRSLSLTNGAGLRMCMPGYSPLYRAETYEGELPEDERILEDVRRWVDGDPAKAKRLDDALMETGEGMSDGALRAFIGKEG